MNYYVYGHFRLDTNEVFYIGIGTISSKPYMSFRSLHYRAYTSRGRNIIWKHIVAKAEYIVRIIYRSNNYNDCKSEEKRLIKLYKRKQEGGTLCNLTDGGDGTQGMIRKISQKNNFSKHVYQFSCAGELIKKWGCAQDVQRELGYAANSICNCCNNKNKTAYGYLWSYSTFTPTPTNRYESLKGLPVVQYDMNGNKIQEWSSAKKAGTVLGIASTSICNCCRKNKYKSAGGFKWYYKENKQQS